MGKATSKKKDRSLLATGGGNATASGVSFQASVAAFIAAQGLAEAPIDARLTLGAAKPIALRFETEVPVDDVLISLDSGGWAFIQGKHSLTNSSSLTSELGKTCDEFARLWEAAASGSGTRGWDRPLTGGTDVMVIAIGPTTSGTIKNHLAHALDIFRSGSTETLSKVQKAALDSFRKLVGGALAVRGGGTAAVNPDSILKLVHVMEFDFGGAHRTAADAVMANALEVHSAASAAFAVLEKECERRMAARSGITVSGLRAELARSGVPLSAPHDYRGDIAALKERTSRVAGALQDFQRTKIGDLDVTIPRTCTAACVGAAKGESLVLIGDPGTGKSAVINETARILRDEGSDIVLLAVDRLQVESLEGLSSALALSHPLPQVLANWPGEGPAYLILDALDACRFGRSEALFRNVMQEVLELDDGRWRVIASIRTFDLIVGQEFGRLFRGVPPDAAFVDQRFQAVRHVRIPEWSDSEFEDLLSKIPDLRIAIDNAGPKLAELARVPFNTRLLTDLLSAGVAPEKFKDLGSQVQLLDMYWNERIRPPGAAAEQCLRNTVTAMIDRGRMEASKIAAGAGTGNVLDQLQHAGVLIPVNGDRDVAFRHHILFDYTASRVAIDLSDMTATKEMFMTKGASLLLAPALSFALQHLWETSGPGRRRFWEAAAEFAGDSSADPVARSVAARAGSDLPSAAGDIAGLLGMMQQPPRYDKAFAAFRHIVSSLTVRLEDKASVPAEPWCAVAAGVAPYVHNADWPLRTLIQNLVDRVEDVDLRRQLGTAARALMDHSFTAERGEMLMPLAIGFMAKTFETDPAASRRLVERVLSPERMAEHAANDMHWLVQEISRISAVDAELAVEIYDRVFSHTIEEDGPTNLGHSRILSLTSNRRQDFKMAQWGLKQAFPAFAREHPLPAADAVAKVAKAYTANAHPLRESVETVTIHAGGAAAKLTADWSYIWAAEHRKPHADDAQQIIDSFVEMLREASDADAVSIAERVIAQNELGWLWNRLFMVGAERGGAFAAVMWPWASQVEFLKSMDTKKRAIDLVASQYALHSEDERIAFERRVLEADFPNSNKPYDARLFFQRKVFGAIDAGALATPEAKAIVEEAIATGSVVANENEGSYFSWVEREDFSWLRDEGADVEAPDNVPILNAIAACESTLSNVESVSPANLQTVLGLRSLLAQLGPGAHALVIAHGWEKVAWAIERITYDRNTVLALTAGQRKDIEYVLESMKAPLAALSDHPGADMVERARKNTAGAIMNMVRAGPETAALFKNSIDELISDPSPDVRDEITRKLGYLWNSDREFLWSLAERFSGGETDARVLVQLVSFFSRAVNDEPDRVGQLTQVLLNRQDIEESKSLDTLREGLGALVFHLWVRHGQAAARAVIDEWLGGRAKHKVELHGAAFSIREGLVLGYDNDDPIDAATRERAQALAFEIVDHTAKGIEAYFALERPQQTEDQNRHASEDATLLEVMSDQFFFALGAPDVGQGREPPALGDVGYRKRFLKDNRRTFARVGDVGTPRPIYYMLQLLEFLEPADPAAVFDLASLALLKAGKLHGYQYESLGADQFVRMIGRTIADHRELFEEQDRRVALVEVLEAFVDAGWPAARRLLYRLPEALR